MFVIDSTFSMSEVWQDLATELPTIIQSATLTGAFSAIKIIAYNDYENSEIVIKQSPWAFVHPMKDYAVGGVSEVLTFASTFKVYSGAACEAATTGVATAESEYVKAFGTNQNNRPFAHIIHIGDQPPHRPGVSGWAEECKFLNSTEGFSGAINRLRKALHNQVAFTTLAAGRHTHQCPEYVSAAKETQGCCVSLGNVPIKNLLKCLFYVGDDDRMYPLTDKCPTPQANRYTMASSVLRNKALEMQRLVAIDVPMAEIAVKHMADICRTNIMALCTSTIIGSMWRAIWINRKANKTELNSAVSQGKSKLSVQDLQTLSNWLDESCNNSNIIATLISDFEETNVVTKRLKYSGVPCNLTSRELIKGLTNFTAFEIRNLSNMLNAIEIRETSDGLPANMPVKDLWGLILHIVVPGTMLSDRLAALVAIMCSRQNNALAGYANEYLESLDPNWFSLDANAPPENFNVGLISLVRKANLKNFDRKYLDFVLGVAKIHPNKILKAKIAVREVKVRADYTEFCTECKCMRSSTIMTNYTEPTTANMVRKAESRRMCGHCFQTMHVQGGTYMRQAVVNDIQVSVSCCKCTGYYAVFSSVAKHMNPKTFECYYCRDNAPTSNQKCTTCDTLIVSEDPLPEGICAECKSGDCAPRYSIVEKSFSVRESIPESGLHTVAADQWGIQLGASETWNSFSQSLFKLLPNVRPMDCKPQACPVWFIPGALNRTDLWHEVTELQNTGEFPECGVCFAPMRDNYRDLCGNPKCTVKACHECMISWYGQCTPGGKINIRSLSCCLCMSVKTHKQLRSFNPKAAQCNLIEQLSAESAAWCRKCFAVCPLPPQACGVATDIVQNFVCIGCMGPTAPKDCPGCGVKTELSGGCLHVSCPNCECEWCYRCATAFASAREVYIHMAQSHATATDIHGYNMIRA